MRNNTILRFGIRYVFIVFMVIFWGWRSPIYAADYYVDIDATGASDTPSNGTSPSAPWQTLHYAVSQLAAGDILHVLPGVYSIANGESDLDITISVSATIVGEPFGQAVIDGTGSASWTNGLGVSGLPSGVRIEGLVIQSFNHGIDVNNSSPEILNNVLIDTATGIYVMANGTDASPTIINNLIYEQSSGAMTYGIYLFGVTTGGTITSEVYHNTIDGGTTDAIYYDQDVDALLVDVRYNNITGFGGYGINYVDPSPAAGSIITYNSFFGNGNTMSGNLSTYESNNISQDPGYAAPATGDYHLLLTSNAVDKIPAVSGDPVTHDQDNKTRTAPFDIGCYEFSDDFTLTVETFGTGQVVSTVTGIICPGDCTETAPYGTGYQLTATPDTGYRFDHWDVDGTGSTVNPIDVVLDKDHQVDAFFVPESTLPLLTSPGQIFPAGTTGILILANTFFTPGITDHAYSRWQVRREDRKSYNNADYDPSFSAVTDTNTGLTAHVVNGLMTGMVYVWKVGYEDSNGSVVWSNEFWFAVGNNVPLQTLQIPGSTLPENFRILSFPIWTRQSLPDLLGIVCDPTAIRIGTWDPIIQGYVECGPGLKVEPGRAFWLLSRSKFVKAPTGIPVTTGLEVEVELLQGWNMIAGPNNRPYSWGAVQILESDQQGGVTFGPVPISSLTDSTYIDPVLWRWESGAYLNDTVRLDPFKGYWVHANRSNLFLKFPDTAVAYQVPAASRKKLDHGSPINQNGEKWASPPPPPMGKNDSSNKGGGCFIMLCSNH